MIKSRTLTSLKIKSSEIMLFVITPFHSPLSTPKFNQAKALNGEKEKYESIKHVNLDEPLKKGGRTRSF